MGLDLLVEPPSAAAAGARVSSTHMKQHGSAEVQHRADAVQCPLALCCWQSEHRCTPIYTSYLCASGPQSCKEKYQQQLPLTSPC